MDGLLPIIRRARRSLVPVAGAAGGADAKPAGVAVKVKPEQASAGQEQQRKEDDAKRITGGPGK
ncbi:MAG TPA: hypothetical protein PLC99_22865 [Verrucomicrobiota bacterium]|nr:hypothetical protein [Verrucomicrobiota bacterium]